VSARALKVLIVGGYGTFGGRIVNLLENEPQLTLIVAGRSQAKAADFCRARAEARARLLAAAFDRDGDVTAQLAQYAPDVVIDASGPFQSYGADRYRLVEACLAHGASYLDLADGSAFVAGIAAFDAAARVAGVHALSGVSSFPVLTAAAVRRLAAGMGRVDAIRGGVAPSPYAGVGGNVIRAIASYAGRRAPMRRGGAVGGGHPFTEQMRYTIAPPGRVPMRSTLYSLVDVPDLTALPVLWPQARDVWIGAGPVPEILHRALIALAWLVRLGVLKSLSPLARLMAWATRHLRWGEHRGGMFVEVAGVDEAGAPLTRSWHLLAEGDSGAMIPAMAAAALVRRSLTGEAPPPGARAATTELDLDAFEPLFAAHAIITGVREERAGGAAGLYAGIFGPAWEGLPGKIRAMHHGTRSAHGRAQVERGRSPLAWLAGVIMGFPVASADTPVGVGFTVTGGVETWSRDFGGHRFASRQFAGTGRSRYLLCERFGPLTFAMALVAEPGGLNLVMRRWTLFGATLPMWLCPRSVAQESVADGRFRFDVAISHPLTGPIVRYHGWLVPYPAADA
jgi:hypothetical protein